MQRDMSALNVPLQLKNIASLVGTSSIGEEEKKQFLEAHNTFTQHLKPFVTGCTKEERDNLNNALAGEIEAGSQRQDYSSIPEFLVARIMAQPSIINRQIDNTSIDALQEAAQSYKMALESVGRHIDSEILSDIYAKDAQDTETLRISGSSASAPSVPPQEKPPRDIILNLIANVFPERDSSALGADHPLKGIFTKPDKQKFSSFRQEGKNPETVQSYKESTYFGARDAYLSGIKEILKAGGLSRKQAEKACRDIASSLEDTSLLPGTSGNEKKESKIAIVKTPEAIKDALTSTLEVIFPDEQELRDAKKSLHDFSENFKNQLSAVIDVIRSKKEQGSSYLLPASKGLATITEELSAASVISGTSRASQQNPLEVAPSSMMSNISSAQGNGDNGDNGVPSARSAAAVSSASSSAGTPMLPPPPSFEASALQDSSAELRQPATQAAGGSVQMPDAAPTAPDAPGTGATETTFVSGIGDAGRPTQPPATEERRETPSAGGWRRYLACCGVPKTAEEEVGSRGR